MELNSVHTEQDHLRQAKRNEDFSKFILRHDRKGEFSDWYSTAVFYSAVHYIEATFHILGPVLRLVAKGVDIQIVIRHSEILNDDSLRDLVARIFDKNTAHSVRMKILKQNDTLGTLYEKYSAIYSTVQSGRYNFMNPNQYDPVSIGKCLNELIEECQKLTKVKVDRVLSKQNLK